MLERMRLCKIPASNFGIRVQGRLYTIRGMLFRYCAGVVWKR